MRYTSTSRTKAIAAGCSRLTATLLPALLPACCHCTTLPHMPSHALPYCTLLCRARVCALYRTPCSQCPLGPPGRFARIHCGRCTGSALVCLACSCYHRVGNRLLVVCFRLLLLSVAFSCCAQYRSYHNTPHPAHNTHPTQITHTTCTSQPTRRAPHTLCTYHTPTMPDITPPTPRSTHTPHPHHTTSNHHTQSSPPISLPQTRSCPRKSEMAYSLFCALDARRALIKSNKFS